MRQPSVLWSRRCAQQHASFFFGGATGSSTMVIEDLLAPGRPAAPGRVSLRRFAMRADKLVNADSRPLFCLADV